MAKIVKRNSDPRVNLGSTPWGNLSALRYEVKTNATGAVLGANVATPIAAGDDVVLGDLPAGFRLFDSLVLVGTGMTAGTGKLGFAYADGVDVPAVPQDAEYFGAAVALNAAARLRSTSVKPSVSLPKTAQLVLNVSAANAKASSIEVIVFGIAEGNATVA